jgi:DNA-directed RNA polymerase subunit RPC12/RpoP
MYTKTCLDCKTAYTDLDSKRFGRCPKCDSKVFIVGTIDDQNSPAKTPSEIEKDERLRFERNIGPEKVKKFKSRLKLELEEIAYREWRALQPEWKTQVAKAESNPTSQAIMGGFVGTQAGATALGVAVGTAGIRYQLSEITENQEGATGGESDGGVLDSPGDFFG